MIIFLLSDIFYFLPVPRGDRDVDAVHALRAAYPRDHNTEGMYDFRIPPERRLIAHSSAVVSLQV